jgi:hypothetical protein
MCCTGFYEDPGLVNMLLIETQTISTCIPLLMGGHRRKEGLRALPYIALKTHDMLADVAWSARMAAARSDQEVTRTCHPASRAGETTASDPAAAVSSSASSAHSSNGSRSSQHCRSDRTRQDTGSSYSAHRGATQERPSKTTALINSDQWCAIVAMLTCFSRAAHLCTKHCAPPFEGSVNPEGHSGALP